MAAVTMNTAEIRNGVQFLESISIVNGGANSFATAIAAGFTGADPAVKKRAVAVPPWATKVVFYFFVDAMAGTSEAIDFVLGVPDFGSSTLIAAPTDATDVATFGNAAWNGITQITGAGPSQVVIEVGPDVTDDDTGSATASCYYGVKGELPPVLTYKITIVVSGDDEDYTLRLAVLWR